MGDWHLTRSFKQRFISAHSSNFWIFIQWIGFGLFILWIDQDEASENVSHLVNCLIRLCIKRSSVNTELRHGLRLQPWLLRFWIRAQVLITKSVLCADPQIAARFHSQLTDSFKSKHKGWILKISLPNSIHRTPRGGCVEIKNCQQGLFLELYEREMAQELACALPLIASVLWFVWVGMWSASSSLGPPCSQSREPGSSASSRDHRDNVGVAPICHLWL